MKRFFYPDDAFLLEGTVVTVGNFDGVHLGHRRILERVLSEKKRLGQESVLVTFSPHPRSVLTGEKVKLLSTLEEKQLLLEPWCIDNLVVVRFDRRFASHSYRWFLERFLINKLGATTLVVGYDHSFGRDGKGKVEQMVHLGRLFGYRVDIVKPVERNGEEIRSGRIRKMLLSGRFAEAVSMLGHPYLVHGKVIPGKGIGKKLGYPTANLGVAENKLLPTPGVYTANATIKRMKRRYPALVYVGSSPTFGGENIQVETYLLNFTEEIYGEYLSLEIGERIGDEVRFRDETELKRKIEEYTRKIK
ncbi:riboflavin biosynthesis protein RibF [bacterium]|nr:riboflavin biosynthesis protein RibF [bacterium]